jgi:hypothetical protein
VNLVCPLRSKNVVGAIALVLTLFSFFAAYAASSATEPGAYDLQPLRPLGDVAVPPTAFSTKQPENDHKGPTQYTCLADLTTTGAAFLGFEAEVPWQTFRQATTLCFSGQGHGNARALEVALVSGHKEIGRFGVSVKHDALQQYEIPLAKLGVAPSERAAATSGPALLRFIVRNTFPGPNGFTLESPKLILASMGRVITAPRETTVPLQKDTFLDLTVADNTGSPYSGKIVCHTSARNEMLIPEEVRCANGKARVPLFVRTAGPHILTLYEPESGAHTSVTIHGKSAGLRVRLFAEEFEKQQSIVAPLSLAPRITLEGGDTIPQSVLITAYDHRGQRQLAQMMSASELSAGRTRILLPLPGLIELRARVYAEPLHEAQRVPSVFPLFVGSRPQDGATTASVALPDGVTTAVVGGYIVALCEAPTTATLLGEDRLALWAFAKVPAEVRLPLTLFGIDHPDVSRMNIVELDKTARKLFAWQVRIGPVWARFPYQYEDVIANPYAYSWPAVQTLAQVAKSRGLRCIIDVPVPPKETVAATLTGSKDAGTTFSNWIKWLTRYQTAVANKLRIFALRTPDPQSLDEPASYDPDALYAVFKNAYSALNSVAETSPSLVADFSGEFDPHEFTTHLPRAVRDWTEAQLVRLNIPLPDKSPDANNIEAQIDQMRNALRKHNLLKRPLWIGPVAWSSHPLWGSELTQANNLVRLYTIAASAKALRVFWADLHDRAQNPWEASPVAFQGLLDAEFRPKPAAIACNLALFMLTSTKPVSASTTGPLTVHAFDIELHSTRWPGRLYVAWTRDESTTATYTLPIGPAGWFAFDYLGAQIDPLKVEPIDTHAHDCDTTRSVTFPITHEPLFIWDVTTIPSRQTHSHHHHDHEETAGPAAKHGR